MARRGGKKYRYIGDGYCPGCGNHADKFHAHHIVPVALGGLDCDSNMIHICEPCHHRIHGRENLVLSSLIKEGIRKARDSGVKLGRTRKRDDARILELREQGLTYREIENQLGYQSGAAYRAIKNAGKRDKDITDTVDASNQI